MLLTIMIIVRLSPSLTFSLSISSAVDKATYMLGSYGPKAESQTAMTPLEEVCNDRLKHHFIFLTTEL